ncbi:uncharacterized protein LOC118495959 isoform X1 [Sander lucioperca]|uniref:uncharacterized protein LOC118495959 isoform X1 n=1 Tax=Sander lucioperca TaxID=283035 RepID=UPI001653C6F4|nr:uncharacterized protein LOC118495959 isoform X1 [Sander lucioperca]
MVATCMCHNMATADCFYALSLNVAQSKRMRTHFHQALTHTVPSPESPEASSSSTTRKRSRKPESSSSSEDKTPVPYQESGTSGLEEELQDMEEEREFMARLQNVNTREGPRSLVNTPVCVNLTCVEGNVFRHTGITDISGPFMTGWDVAILV